MPEGKPDDLEHPPQHRDHDGTAHAAPAHSPAVSVFSVTCTQQSIPSGCLQSILVPEADEFSQWEAEGELSERPITAVIPGWRTLTTLDMSHNGISTIDRSVVRTLLSASGLFYAANYHLKIIRQSRLHHLHPLCHQKNKQSGLR